MVGTQVSNAAGMETVLGSGHNGALYPMKALKAHFQGKR